jgi:glutaminyl-peptide cyclotransferase
MKKSLVIASVLMIIVVVVGASIIVFLNNNKPQSTPQATPRYTYAVVNTYPHDTNAFTEGLVYSDGFLYESTGLNSASSLRRVNLTTGAVQQEVTLSSQYFGEGITVVNDTIFQLTWQSNIGFIYNKTTFAAIGNFTYPTEGWGLTYNGAELIMSDGTNNLYFIDPTTFENTGQIQVHDGNKTVVNINELEYVNGDIFANIWQTSTIAIINPQTGQVKGWIDLTGLSSANENNSNSEAVLNGIAYDQENDRLFVTGKDWANLYEIRIMPLVAVPA